MQLLPGVDVVLHGMLHAVEGADQLADFVIGFGVQILLGKVIDGNAPGSFRQQQNGMDHHGRQQPQNENDKHQRDTRQGDQHPGDPVEDLLLVVVVPVSIFHGFVDQPQGIFGQAVLHFYYLI